MSWGALDFASKMRVKSAADKLIAIAYADRYHDETGIAYPSIAWLVEFSCLNRKTVIASVARLEAMGFLTDTGERKGTTKQIKVYALNIGTVPKTGQSPIRNSSEIAPKQSQKRDTEPVREPISQKATPSSRARTTSSKVLHFRLPDDWKPSRFADGTVAREIIDRRGQEWARAALESFRAWAANADDKNGAGRKLDWQAAWVKWVIEQDKRDGRPANNGMAGNRLPAGGSRDGFTNAIRESRANREAVPWDAGNTAAIPRLAGMG